MVASATVAGGAASLTVGNTGTGFNKYFPRAVAASVAGSLKTWDNGAVGSGGKLLNLAVGDTILQEDNIQGDKLTTVATVTSARDFVTSKGGALGAPTVSVITEVATGANTYNYVAQCSNRGTC